MLSSVIQNNVFQDQAILTTLNICLSLNHGRIIPTAASIILSCKIIPAGHDIRSAITAGNGQVLIIEPGTLGHGQIRHHIDDIVSTFVRIDNFRRFRQACIGFFTSAVTGLIITFITFFRYIGYINGLFDNGSSGSSSGMICWLKNAAAASSVVWSISANSSSLNSSRRRPLHRLSPAHPLP